MKHLLSLRSRAVGPVARPIHRALLMGALGAVLVAGTAAQAADSGVKVSDPWMRLVVPSRPAAGYFTLSNDTTKAQVLVGAASPACGMLMLHQSV